MNLSDKEQKLLDFIKSKETSITVETIEKELGRKYLGALGKLMQNELIESGKKRTECPSNPYGIKFVKYFGIKQKEEEND